MYSLFNNVQEFDTFPDQMAYMAAIYTSFISLSIDHAIFTHTSINGRKDCLGFAHLSVCVKCFPTLMVRYIHLLLHILVILNFRNKIFSEVTQSYIYLDKHSFSNFNSLPIEWTPCHSTANINNLPDEWKTWVWANTKRSHRPNAVNRCLPQHMSFSFKLFTMVVH